jgi:hypothetical protein
MNVLIFCSIRRTEKKILIQFSCYSFRAGVTLDTLTSPQPRNQMIYFNSIFTFSKQTPSSGFLINFCTHFFLSMYATCPAQLTLLKAIHHNVSEEHKLQLSSICNFLLSTCFLCRAVPLLSGGLSSIPGEVM